KTARSRRLAGSISPAPPSASRSRRGARSPGAGRPGGSSGAGPGATRTPISARGPTARICTTSSSRWACPARGKPKSCRSPTGGAVAPVAKGDVGMAVITLANIVNVPGVELAGLLPRDMQHYTVYTAGVATGANNADGARALLGLIMAPETTPVIEAEGMER